MTRLAHPAKLARQAAYWRLHGRPEVAERLEAQLAANKRCRRGQVTLLPEGDPHRVSDPAGIAENGQQTIKGDHTNLDQQDDPLRGIHTRRSTLDR
jgi:hypothetical protein